MGEYQKDGLEWRLEQLSLRLQEWWEWRTSQVKIDLPDIDIPLFDWLTTELIEKIGGILFWLILILLLIGLGRALSIYVEGLKRLSFPSTMAMIKSDGKTSSSQWVERSQQYLKQHNYRDACVCLYQGMLQLLDERNLIPQHHSRTDGEYWRLVERFLHPLPYQTLLSTHQSLRFGNVEASLKTWQNCEEAYRQIETDFTSEQAYQQIKENIDIARSAG
ncbi:DUF4129 domain-containing protein [Gloeocapsa sp. PCC 73106]|uniref:DUF4129 domain-containing protein n=1 Tax=Gloeocapsa sp. PCC 73106 TaxID=102232 RepID=UPI0002AC327A|nr:DUF4129 domain-containing protein [Gloeocapsa sp. PCC 73106]ELS00135.1 hypothetical protein GLO73106DRAFT_00039900 [Gloeocapsa sp. PCC 73106]